MKMKAPTPQFWAALISYTGAVGLALSLDPEFVPGDVRGAAPRLACLALLWLGNYIETRIAINNPLGHDRQESALWALHATLAVAVVALVPLGLEIFQSPLQTEDWHPATAVLFVILGFVAYYKVGKSWIRRDNSQQQRPEKHKKERSTTFILMAST